jgi:ADP-ribose pyrophosphatase YjhB (NUDIX family)
MKGMQEGFNVRAYGILKSPNGREVMVIEETVFGKLLVKFPGGGVDAFEGPGHALIREFKEELDVDVELGEVFYVSPNFHKSFFRPQQVIGIYWEVKLKAGEPKVSLANYRFYWEPLQSIDPSSFTHPMDQEVVRKLMADCGRS